MAPLDYNATVSQRVEIAPGFMILRVVPDRLPFVFAAGQYTVLGMKGTVEDPEKLVRRAYSIASSSRADEFIEFYLALVPSGELTPKLFGLRVRDRLFMGTKATGMFTLARVPRDKNVILVGTGTGLAPYMSMLRSEVECGGAPQVVVLHGARYSWDLAYRTELVALSQKCPNIGYLPVVSRREDDPTWGGLTGYLQDVLFSGELERRTGVLLDPEQAHVFLCGNPLMIEAAKARLVAERGYVPDHQKEIGTLHLEEYW
jgi:ferredoxin--NADP+ reductase